MLLVTENLGGWDWVFQTYEPPLYFVTLWTAQRRKLLANKAAQSALVSYGQIG